MARLQAQEKRSKKTPPSSRRSSQIENQKLATHLSQPERESTSEILLLQKTVGNQAITALLAGKPETGRALLVSPPVQRQEEAASLSDYPSQLLRFGSRGEQVQTAQEMLNRHGFNLVADGIFGPLTHQAVRAFQQAKNLEVDGIIGPITWGALNGHGSDGGETETPPDEQPVGLSLADLQALAATFTAAGTDLLIQEPLVGSQVMPVFQAAAEQLLVGSATPQPQVHGATPGAEEASQPEVMRKIDRSSVMRQAPAPGAPQNPVTDPGRLQALQEVKQIFAKMLDFIANDLGKRPLVGPAGGPGDPVRTQVLSLDAIHRYFTPLLAQPWPTSQDPVTDLARKELELFLRRTAAMRGFYNSVLPPAAALTGDETTAGFMPAQNRPTDPRRLQIAGNGLADLGKVKAAEVDSDKRRIGYQHLQVIFDTAWPTHVADGVPNSLIEKKKPGKKLKHGGDKNNPDDFIITNDTLPSWCGVGATYWAKKTEGSFPDWVMGIGVVNQLEKRTKKELPEVGDILASINQGHHGVVTWVDPAATPPKTNNEWAQIQIKTVEANINGQIVETPASHSTLAYWTVGVFKPFS